MYQISDDALNRYYARNYYGPGTDYFDPPEYAEEDYEEEYEEEYEDEI